MPRSCTANAADNLLDIALCFVDFHVPFILSLVSFRNRSVVESVRNQVMEKVRGKFRPEFINRLDEILLFRRLGVKVMLLIGMLAWFVRYAMFALGVSEEGRILLYLGILLHGVCYDFFFVVGFIYTDRVAGEKVKGQAQSMIVMFTYGIGMLLGSQISGALYNQLVAGQTVPQAWVTFWWIPAVAAAVIALIFLFSFQYREKEQH